MSKNIYNCIDCDKIYSSYNTLWKHNKTFHNSRKPEKNDIIEKDSGKFECRVCGKDYIHNGCIIYPNIFILLWILRTNYILNPLIIFNICIYYQRVIGNIINNF